MPPITNTLETTRRLEGMGFPAQQARGLAELLEETASASNQDLKGYLDSKVDLIISKIDTLRQEMRADSRDLESRLEREMRLQLFWFASIQGILFATLIALVKLFL